MNGKPDREMDELYRLLEEARRSVIGQWKSGGAAGFLDIPDLKKELVIVEKMADEVRREFSTLVVVGIGGSDLGARAMVKGLGVGRKQPMNIRFIGANTDPSEINALLSEINWKKTAINVISKSGDTIEPMSTFLILRDRLIRKVGAKKHARHVIATTDSSRGALREIANREGYRTLEVADNIGGRFSALTAVGLFPAACRGIDVTGLLSGARQVRADFLKDKAADSFPLLFAGLQHDAYFRGGRVTVIMPYAEAFREFGFWFRQLWAESLGKKTDRSGRTMRVGFTPVAALGATDQHSQIQLYNEGPADKTVTFIEVSDFGVDLTVPKSYPDIDGVSYLGGKKMSAICHAEREATALSLAKSGRPNGTIRIEAITSESMGALMMSFMLATAAIAELMEINAYDQPGVEEGKRTMYALLQRQGFNL